jgi:hypothetical protein
MESEANDAYPELPKNYKPVVQLLEDAGAAGGLTEEELCEALTGHYQKKDSKPATIRQQRRRAKDALLKAKVLKERDERYHLAI